MNAKFTLKDNDTYFVCPKCGNNKEFTAHSQQVSEDCCEVWVKCKCGFDPSENNHNYRFEDVGGGICNGTIAMALDCWNDAIDDKIYDL